MEHSNTLALSYQDLACYTDNFAESNYLGPFQFGKFYHGKIVRDGLEQYVMVKIWQVSEIYNYRLGDNESRLVDEVMLLRHPMLINHPNLLRLYGYCYEEDHLGVVYDFKPFDSLYNLITKDDFTWLQRISVSLRFASLLRFLHSGKCESFKPIIVRNIDCAHIVFDEDYNPKLCDFGLVSGGIIPDRTIYKCHHVIGSYGYVDMSSYYKGHYSYKQDVFAFGVILLSLISKRVFTEEDRQDCLRTVCQWAWDLFTDYEIDSVTNSNMPKFSLADESLAADPDFDPADGRKITALALECTDSDLSIRPTMKQVLRSLLKLKVVKKHAADLGLNQFLRPM